MSEDPHSQEELYNITLKDFIEHAKQLQWESKGINNWQEKLAHCKKVKEAINKLYTLMSEIMAKDMFDKRRKDTCINVFKILSELLKSDKDKLLSDAIFN